MSRLAFITGIGGQDGSYLARYLIIKNFLVYGFTRSLKKNNLRKNLLRRKQVDESKSTQ